MKALALVSLLALTPLVAPLPEPTSAPVGAPSRFTVTRTTVDCEVGEEADTVRVVYDLAILDPACGWVCAELARLPGPSASAKAVLRVDELTLDGIVAREGDAWRVGMSRKDPRRIARELAEAKSVQLELMFETRPANGLLTVPLDAPRPLWRANELQPALGALDVRLANERSQGLASMTASYPNARPGSELVVRHGADGASVLLTGRVGSTR